MIGLSSPVSFKFSNKEQPCDKVTFEQRWRGEGGSCEATWGREGPVVQGLGASDYPGFSSE